MSIINDIGDKIGETVKRVGEVKEAVAKGINDGVNFVSDPIRDRRKAEVVVVNETGGLVRNVHVKHKYSSNFRSARTWTEVEAGTTSNPPLEVEHATGVVTTGMDWWFVCWTDAAGSLVHTGGGPGLGLVKLAEDVALTVGKALSAGASSAVKLTGIIGENVENYNAHTLSSESGRRPVRIVLKPDGVLFDSPGKDDETFKLVTVPPGVWKGWNAEFEKIWDLDEVALLNKLYFGRYSLLP